MQLAPRGLLCESCCRRSFPALWLEQGRPARDLGDAEIMTGLPVIGSKEEFATWRASPDLWRALVQDIARTENVPATALIPYTTGTNLVVDLDGRLVLKLFPPLYRSQFVSERATLRVLDGRLSVPIPQIVAEGEREGWPYLIMTRLDGITGSEAWSTLAEAEKERSCGPSVERSQRCRRCRRASWPRSSRPGQSSSPSRSQAARRGTRGRGWRRACWPTSTSSWSRLPRSCRSTPRP